MWFYNEFNLFVRCYRAGSIFCRKRSTYNLNTKEHVPEPEYDTQFLCNPCNRNIIFNNIMLRKGIGDIDKVLQFSMEPLQKKSLFDELSKIPNQTDPRVLSYGNEPYVLKECGFQPAFDFKHKQFSELVEKLRLLKTKSLRPFVGQRGYVLLGDLANLEEALVCYTIDKLMGYGFKLISVPDVIPTEIVERCGLISEDGRTLSYNLDPHYGQKYSLSGTAEMSLAYKIMNTLFNPSDLPLKMTAVSRCFRAEISNLMEERGLYRVHYFTKVEMFVCSAQENSAEQFHALKEIQENLFSSLGLHFRILDMPPHELGAAAYRKIDMEGWMPGKELYGEISSCSNCTDYQSRRLNIKYKTKNADILHVHTLNGTACAIPRMLISLCETYQTRHGCIKVPEVLLPYMRKKELIRKQQIPNIRTHKYKIQT